MVDFLVCIPSFKDIAVLGKQGGFGSKTYKQGLHFFR